jgi:hypothetical protein
MKSFYNMIWTLNLGSIQSPKRRKMKIASKNILCLFITIFSQQTTFASFKHSQKTYLSPRTYRPESHMQWHLDYDKKNNFLSGNMQVSAFYQHSTNSSDIGRYFGIGNGKNSFEIGDSKEIEGDIFIRRWEKEAAGTITLKPKHIVYGVNLEYLQKANKFFIKTSLPINNVKNDVGLKITNAVNAKITGGGKEYALANLFKGKLTINEGNDKQKALTHAKINGSRTTGGVSDFEVKFGYKINHTDKQYTTASLDVLIPTGNKAKGEHLWEPIYGNGHHPGLGGSFDCGFHIYEGDIGTLWLTGGANYKYLFSNTQKRTLNLTFFKRKFSQYITVGRYGKQDPLFPLANISTNDVKVTPGGQVNHYVNLSLQKNNTFIDVGYHLYWKDNESVISKETDKTRYAVPFADYESSNLLDDARSYKLDSIKSSFENIEQKLLDERSAATPMQLTQKLSADIRFKKEINQDINTMIGFGGSFELAQGNSALDQFALWFKTSISF